MNGPHRLDFHTNVCSFCGKDTRRLTDWELCPKAPEVKTLPAPGQIWDTLLYGRVVRTSVTAVDAHGNWWWGHTSTMQDLYTISYHSVPIVKWPEEGSRLVQDVPNPWGLDTENRPTRAKLSLISKQG